MSRPSAGWTTGAWLAICAGLAAVVAYQLVNSFPLAPTVTAAPPRAPLLELAERPEPPRSPGEDAVETIAARPLFSADRRPYVPPAPVEEVVAAAKPSLPLELAGTFLTATDQAALILVAGQPPAWLRAGQSIEGWRIGTIEENRVLLLKGEQERELQLREDNPALQKSGVAPGRRKQQERQSGIDPKEASLRDPARGLDDEDREPD